MAVGLGDFDASLAVNASDAEGQKPIPIKVVVVTMFEIGEDTGDRPGEFETLVEQLRLPETIPFPHGQRDLR
jgi:purine nucleoside permease